MGKSLFQKKWEEIKERLREKHPDWSEERISIAAARKIDQLKRRGMPPIDMEE